MKSSFRLPVLSFQFTKILFFFSHVIFHMLPVPAVYAKFPDRIVSLAPSTTEILRLLRELKDGKNISIIMALHDINIALKFDKVMLTSVCL